MVTRLFRHCLLLAATCAFQRMCAATTCNGLPEERKKAITSYVVQKYKLPPSVTLHLVTDKVLAQSCVHELTFEGITAIKTWTLPLYLSSDGRYLSSDLFDTTADPLIEEKIRQQALMNNLSENRGASDGEEAAPVTIVVFSDFQCPFCKEFARTMRLVLRANPQTVRVIFHHLPLSIHSWARQAATGAACAQLQNNIAFWSLHDRLFEEQTLLTENNIKAKLLEFAQETSTLDLREYQSCLKEEMSLGLVLRDVNLAAFNEINSTPTIFINGMRVRAVKDANELQLLVNRAAIEAGRKVKEN